MATWPSTPEPYEIQEEHIYDPIHVNEFEDGTEVRMPRWHRHKKEFVLTYRGLDSANPTTQAIYDFTIFRDFLIARRLQYESFTFTHPWYMGSSYVVRYNGGESLPLARLAFTKEDNTHVFEMSIRLKEVF